jgi:hypothetical protein
MIDFLNHQHQVHQMENPIVYTVKKQYFYTQQATFIIDVHHIHKMLGNSLGDHQDIVQEMIGT